MASSSFSSKLQGMSNQSPYEESCYHHQPTLTKTYLLLTIGKSQSNSVIYVVNYSKWVVFAITTLYYKYTSTIVFGHVAHITLLLSWFETVIGPASTQFMFIQASTFNIYDWGNKLWI